MKYILILFCIVLNAQIQGTVVSKNSYWENGNIYTSNKLDNGKEIITLGGIVGLNAEVVSDTPQLHIGQKGKFYLSNGKLNRFESNIINSTANATVTPTTAVAGIGDIVTINGLGFGERNQLSFPNADFGGALVNIEDSLILSWNDTEITCIVPPYAGSGSLVVRTLENGDIQTNELTIPYAITNINYIGEYYKPELVSDNDLGGYTWQYSASMDELSKSIFEEALNEWRCNTKINWNFGEDVDIQTIANDGINIITFSETGTLPSSVLGRCTTRYSGCFVGDSIEWYITEKDLVFNSDVVMDFTNNNGSGFHFQTIALHELGHAHGQGHVIDSNKLMHYSLNQNDFKITLGDSDLQGGTFFIDTSDGQCGIPPMTKSEFIDCYTLSDDDYDTDEKQITSIKHYDLLGRNINNIAKNTIYIKIVYFYDGSKEITKVLYQKLDGQNN